MLFCKKAKWLSEEALQIAKKRREVKSKREPCVVWKGFPAFPAHLRMRPVSRPCPGYYKQCCDPLSGLKGVQPPLPFGAGDLRELARVPLRGEGSCGGGGAPQDSAVSEPIATSWTVAHQAPLSMGFSRQEYWSRLPCPPPGDLPDPGIKSTSPDRTSVV